MIKSRPQTYNTIPIDKKLTVTEIEMIGIIEASHEYD
jgi:hypothetical protein